MAASHKCDEEKKNEGRKKEERNKKKKKGEGEGVFIAVDSLFLFFRFVERQD